MLTVDDLTVAELQELLALAEAVKTDPQEYQDALAGDTLALWFEHPSLRTRTSFVAGMNELGGGSVDITPENSHRKEDLQEETACLNRYVDFIAARVDAEDTLETMDDVANVPVINALSPKYHPCQALADVLTIQEYGIDSVAYIGDGTNVANSLIIACEATDISLSVATPKPFQPDVACDWTDDPYGAVHTADAVYTDAHSSLNDQDDNGKAALLEPYTVTEDLLGDRYFMHCLPAGEESEEVLDSQQSIVYDQTENKLHAQKAVLLHYGGAI